MKVKDRLFYEGLHNIIRIAFTHLSTNMKISIYFIMKKSLLNNIDNIYCSMT